MEWWERTDDYVSEEVNPDLKNRLAGYKMGKEKGFPSLDMTNAFFSVLSNVVLPVLGRPAISILAPLGIYCSFKSIDLKMR